MILKKGNGLLSITQMLSIMIVSILLSTGTVGAESQQKSSDQLLSEIIDLHSELVTNEQFLAQAKMLGAYLEAAKSLDEPKRIEIYAKVLNILKKIKLSSTSSSTISEPNKVEGAAPEQSLVKEKQGLAANYKAGAALLEIFKTDSMQNLPDLPVIRTYWKNNLAYSGSFLLPKRAWELGKAPTPCVARFSFYYSAEKPGKYSFTVIAGDNTCKLTVGGTDVAKSSRRAAGQGICLLEQGFYRIELWLVSRTMNWGRGHEADFQVRVLTPDAFDAVPLTKNMMLIKEEAETPK